MRETTGLPPLIATALPDTTAQVVFTDLRTRHFPPDRNIVPAHISLFHQLPGSDLDKLTSWLTTRLADQLPFSARTRGMRFLGHGVAIDVDCDALMELHAAMADEWREVLIPQDRQAYRPHVTIQNKAEPAAARALYEEMLAELAPLDFTIPGIRLWWYLGGVWKEAETVLCGDDYFRLHAGRLTLS